ncbi:hypothetical protein CHUAL_007160 [Chamberlinius hualienensis]
MLYAEMSNDAFVKFYWQKSQTLASPLPPTRLHINIQDHSSIAWPTLYICGCVKLMLKMQKSTSSTLSDQITYCSMDPLNSSTFSVHIKNFDEDLVRNSEDKVIIGGHYIVRKREIWFVSSAVIFFITCIVLAATVGLSYQNLDNRPATIATVTCDKPQCYQLSSRIIGMINQSVDSCDNFEQFVCGKSTPITVAEETFDKFSENLKLILGTISSDDDHDDVKFKVKKFYQSCVVDSHGIRLKGEPVLTLINQIGGWNGLFNYHEKQWNIADSIQTFSCNLLIDGFFSFSIEAKLQDTKIQNYIKLSVPSKIQSSMWSNQFWEPEILQSYIEMINSTAELLLDDYYKLAKQQLTDNARQMIKSFAADAVYMENRLYRLAFEAPNQFYTATAVKIPLQQMFHHFQFMNWRQCFNDAFTTAIITNESSIYVENINYFNRLDLLLQQTPKRTINNFMVWRTVLEFLPYLNLEYQNILAKYQTTLTKVDRIPSIEKHCLHILQTSILRSATLTLLLDKDNSNLNQIGELIDDIQDSVRQQFVSRFHNNQTIKKVKNLKVIPETKFLNDSLLVGKFYSTLQVSDNFFNNVLAMRQFIKRKLGEIVANPFEASAAAVFLNSDQYLLDVNNTALIPIQYLWAPFIHFAYPQQVIYARLGTAIAQIIIKQSIIQDDETSSLLNTLKTCMNELNSRFTFKGMNPQLQSNMNYLIKLLAVKIAFESYQTYLSKIKKDFTLPGLQLYTLEQLFLIVAFQVNCKNEQIDNLNDRPHSPSDQRVNVWKQLASVFECQTVENRQLISKCKALFV